MNSEEGVERTRGECKRLMMQDDRFHARHGGMTAGWSTGEHTIYEAALQVLCVH